ncbi:MAG TPA: rod shape-determining protein MreC [Actinomycetes bacterium]|nr:rod shape-determining protein MreC [Actinomycetes bacterium]
MYERPRRARAIFVLLLLAAVTVITVDFRQRPDGPVDRLQRAASSVFGPLQRAVSAVVRPIGDTLGGIAETGSLRRRNRQLQAEVERLRAAERTNADLLGENQQLRGALAMARRCGCRTVGAQVVARSGSTFQWSVTIDAGTRQGITRDMAVINGDGLVGRVVRVGADYADVRLVSDPSSGIAAALAGSRSPGLLRGRGERDLDMELLHPDAPVRTGEPVITQGYPQGVFPPGLPVGVVTATPPARDLVRRLVVRPFADVDSLDVVAVVVAKPARPKAPPRAAEAAGRPAGTPSTTRAPAGGTP